MTARSALTATAKAKAQGILCLSNLKQLQLAWFMYAGDNNDRLVPNGTGDQRGWVEGWLPTAEDATNIKPAEGAQGPVVELQRSAGDL